jgi:hypothetical protein
MLALFVGLVATLIGVAAHVVLLRRLSGPLLFLSVPALLLVALVLAVFFCRVAIGPPSLMDMFLGFTLSMSLGLSYVLLLVGVVYDSPTLALTGAIVDHGPGGMPVEVMPEVARRHPFLRTRLSALVAGGQVALEGNDVVARQPAASGLVRLGAVYRRWRGADTPAG